MKNERGKYQKGTIVRLKRTGEFASIESRFYLKEEREFLHYLAAIEGRRNGLYALYDEDIELECLPPLIQ